MISGFVAHPLRQLGEDGGEMVDNLDVEPVQCVAGHPAFHSRSSAIVINIHAIVFVRFGPLSLREVMRLARARGAVPRGVLVDAEGAYIQIRPKQLCGELMAGQQPSARCYRRYACRLRVSTSMNRAPARHTWFFVLAKRPKVGVVGQEYDLALRLVV